MLVRSGWLDGWPNTLLLMDSVVSKSSGLVASSREILESSKMDGGSEAMTAKQETKGRSWGLVCCVVNAIMPSFAAVLRVGGRVYVRTLYAVCLFRRLVKKTKVGTKGPRRGKRGERGPKKRVVCKSATSGFRNDCHEQ